MITRKSDWVQVANNTSASQLDLNQDALQLAPKADNSLEYEQSHVHEVYGTIADHYSATRYKVRM